MCSRPAYNLIELLTALAQIATLFAVTVGMVCCGWSWPWFLGGVFIALLVVPLSIAGLVLVVDWIGERRASENNAP